jgi:hypothetical protein
MSRNDSTRADILQHDDRFLHPKEAAAILATSVNTLNFWRCNGRGPKFYRHGRSIRYLLSDLTAWGKARCGG